MYVRRAVSVHAPMASADRGDEEVRPWQAQMADLLRARKVDAMLQMTEDTGARGSADRHAAEAEAFRLLQELGREATAEHERAATLLLHARATRGGLDAPSCEHVLKLCAARRSSILALRVIEAMRSTGLPPSREAYELALEACPGTASPLLLLDQMATDGVLPAATTYERFFSACRRHGAWLAAARPVWKQMVAAGVRPSDVTIRHYLRLCAGARAWREAERELRRWHATLERRHWDLVLLACERADALEAAERIFEELPHGPEVDDFNALLRCYARETGDPRTWGDRKARAQTLLRRMEDASVAPDEFTHHALMAINQYEPSAVLRYFRQMKEAGLPRHLGTYALVMRSAWFTRDAELLSDLAAEMQADGLVPDSRFYASQIEAASSVGMYDEADLLYRQSVAAGCPPRARAL